jgi:hypothetical protein
MMQQGSNLQRYTNNRWSTRAQASNRASINLDEAFAEQWQQIYG